MPIPATLTAALAGRFADIALGHVRREYPHKLDHVLGTDDDARTPRQLHPIFYGSFDWHSCVHGYWMLARLRRACPDLPQAAAIAALFEASFTASNIEGERAYLDRPLSSGFERPYGWAWLLMLAGELRRGDGRAQSWAAAMAPLEAAFVERLGAYLAKLTYPIRAGTHANTAFALVLAADYAEAAGDDGLRDVISAWARDRFGADCAAQAWEPSGDDFLSPTLIEAQAVAAALPPGDFVGWLDAFLPDLAERGPPSLFAPAFVSDRTDGKIAHLDGLNLSRAWGWRSIGARLETDDPRRAICAQTARLHLDAALPHVAGDYMGEHWLASFATLALTAEEV